MALSDIDISAHDHRLYVERDFEPYTGRQILAVAGSREFARAIEAEVHKQDTALIRQLVEAIEAETSDTWECSSYHPKLHDAVAAANARLEGKP